MAKRKSANPFLGRWLIEHMDQWDVAEESEELQPFIEFEQTDTGRFQFGCVYGEMDYRLGQREGKSAVEFSWEGHDEDEQVFGRGWAIVDGDNLSGMIFFHHGDDSGIVAKRLVEKHRRKNR
jgi:hypothetical protein